MSDSGREMTRTEMMVRISELAAERDAAIDARLTAERDAATLANQYADVKGELDRAGVPDSLANTLPSRVRWLVGQNRQLAIAATAVTNGDAFVMTRTAWHLAHGCDTAQRARELALAEWDAGVLGVVK